MTEEFNLSKRIFFIMVPSINEDGSTNFKLLNKADLIYAMDVKEFIKRLKEELPECWSRKEFADMLDTLAGDKLK